MSLRVNLYGPLIHETLYEKGLGELMGVSMVTQSHRLKETEAVADSVALPRTCVEAIIGWAYKFWLQYGVCEY